MNKLKNFLTIAGLTTSVCFSTNYKIFHSLEASDNQPIQEKKQEYLFYCGDLNHDGRGDQIIYYPDGKKEAWLRQKNGKYKKDDFYTQRIQEKNIEQILRENKE